MYRGESTFNPVSYTHLLTNRRFIHYKQGALGNMSFDDYLWRDLHNCQLKDGMIASTLSYTTVHGQVLRIEYIPKVQARRIYRISQEREEAAMEERRQRDMEERRAGANQVVLNSPIQGQSTAPAPAPIEATPVSSGEDPVAKLTKLKQMLDAGLIEQAEFDAAKTRILDAM